MTTLLDSAAPFGVYGSNESSRHEAFLPTGLAGIAVVTFGCRRDPSATRHWPTRGRYGDRKAHTPHDVAATVRPRGEVLARPDRAVPGYSLARHRRPARPEQ